MKPCSINNKQKIARKYVVCACLASSILYGYGGSVDAKESVIQTVASITPTTQLTSLDRKKAKEDLMTAVAKVMKLPPKQEVVVEENKTPEAVPQETTTQPIIEPQAPIIETSSQPQASVVTPTPTQAPFAPSVKQEPVQQTTSNPIAKTALSLVGRAMWCEEVAEASIQSVGKTAWLHTVYEEGDVLVEESSMGPDNFLKIASQVSLANLQPGDLLYYANNGSGISHIAVYVGNGQAVHGGFGGANVVLSGIYLPNASTPIGLRV